MRCTRGRPEDSEMKTCPHCQFTFTPPRSNAVYCSSKCKQAAKKRRQRSNPKVLKREREAKRTAYQRNLAEGLGFTPRDGFVGELRETKRRTKVDDLFDHDDEFADLVATSHPPRKGGDWEEIIIFADPPFRPAMIAPIHGVSSIRM